MTRYFPILHEGGRQGAARVCEQPTILDFRSIQSLDSTLRPHAVFGTTALCLLISRRAAARLRAPRARRSLSLFPVLGGSFHGYRARLG